MMPVFYCALLNLSWIFFYDGKYVSTGLCEATGGVFALVWVRIVWSNPGVDISVGPNETDFERFAGLF